MKIEKGKLYYNYQLESVVIAVEDSNDNSGILSDKIAVYCKTKEDFEYIESKGYKLTTRFYGKSNYRLYYNTYNCNSQYHIISIDQFKELYPDNSDITNKNDDNVQNNGHKESSNKLNYELDFDFITQISERMQTNKGKYEPYNWKKPIDVESLKQALFRHVIEVMKGNYQDDGRLMGHLEAISLNAMMLNYQLKLREK